MLLGEGLVVLGATYPPAPEGLGFFWKGEAFSWKNLKSGGDLLLETKLEHIKSSHVSETILDVIPALKELEVPKEETVVNQMPSSELQTRKKTKFFNAMRLLLLLTLFTGIATFLGFLLWSNSVQTTSVRVLSWLEELPIPVSSSILAFLYAIGLLVFCPGTPFNLASGFLFGLWWGFGVAIVGCSVGASVAFVLGRTIAREWIKSKMQDKPTFKAIDLALRKNGTYIVFLTRLSPLFPFPLLNYAFGITKIASWQYVVGTVAGSAPGTFAYCYLGTLMRNIADIWTSPQGSNHSTLWLVLGGVLTVLSVVVISVITQRAISKATKEYEVIDSQSSPEGHVILEMRETK